MIDLEVRGAGDELAALSRRLKAAGRGDLRKQLQARLRAPAREIAAAQKARVRGLDHAPREWKAGAARSVRVRTRLTGDRAGVKISVPRTEAGRHGWDMNRGEWRHPLFGDKEHWYPQRVQPGWFDEPAQVGRPVARRAVLAAMRDVAEELARGR